MSLISDALNKAQRDRSQTYGATLYRSPGSRRARPRPPGRFRPALVWIGVTSSAAFLLVAGVVTFRSEPPASRAGTAPDVAVTPVADAPAVTADDRPAPASEEPRPLAAPPAATAEYELAGMSAMGSTTLLSIVRRSDRRATWVPVGKTVGEVTAVSFDPGSDRAVIRVHGTEHTLALRDVGAPAGAAAE